ncbi:MAG: hypothetical protein OXU81_18905 [Gammaproteobacteria bacterium]|nr:hypothetical protein [Gammaproteobacteria bacterium]
MTDDLGNGVPSIKPGSTHGIVENLGQEQLRRRLAAVSVAVLEMATRKGTTVAT